MKTTRSLLVLLALAVIFPTGVFAEFDFSLMVDDLNVAARSNQSRFNVQAALAFGVPIGKVERLVETLGSPGDAYMSLKVGILSGRNVDEVVRARKSSPGEGWGKTAQKMGIKPGSDEFMQLKQKPGKKHKKAKKKQNKSKK